MGVAGEGSAFRSIVEVVVRELGEGKERWEVVEWDVQERGRG